mmetsp:Transcript_8852/g.17352  ORF Transcript_8852/g.17352 Transcript_8852/m.17352 type:complete len:237 (-) Transcript_8852:83-793(-)|eukprot:CAMPEP_0170178756 /NCGR_PEP_ID=MMETSP0040_2-20121228/13783_1 /TAXON_ID=641309 /ORGANISM="Lotharella oceanica, Strain CCMP622" /LENGTH=236 /DNA_ID=CAMNT_0010422207 /DNA_START=58 /DNA_END=768 /DNA_ORIENTATION=-
MSEEKEQMKAVRRGAFILFEGIDRCGKTTQSKRLVEALNKKGIKSEHMRFPDRTTSIGQMINSYLSNAVDTDDRSIHLLFAANRWEKMKQMRELLESGVNLVVDRYSYSGVAFTASKGYEIEWCYQPEVGMIEPDIVVWLDMPLEDVKTRGGFGNERYEKMEMQGKVQGIFKMFSESNLDKWKYVDARGTIDEIHEKILKIGEEAIEGSAHSPLSLMKPLNKSEDRGVLKPKNSNK